MWSDAQRLGIDPNDRLGATQLRQVEKHALELLALLPGAALARTRDAIELVWGGERGVVILVTAETIEVRLPTIEWIGPHDPAESSKLWRRRRWDSLREGELARLLDQAVAARAREHQECRFCHRSSPPEHMFDIDVCYGCAERHLGVRF